MLNRFVTADNRMARRRESELTQGRRVDEVEVAIDQLSKGIFLPGKRVFLQ
jgi:hypothetical protein